MLKKIIVDEEWVQKNPFCLAEEAENGNLIFFSSFPFSLEAAKNHLENYLARFFSAYVSFWKEDLFPSLGKKREQKQMDVSKKRPLHGSRILRLLINEDPKKPVLFKVSCDLDQVAQKVRIPQSPRYDLIGRLKRKMTQWAVSLKVKKGPISPYDRFMARANLFLRKNKNLQDSSEVFELAPLSGMAFFSDMISYSLDRAECIFEKGWIIPQKSLLCPEKSPVCLLERVTGKNLVDPEYLASSIQ